MENKYQGMTIRQMWAAATAEGQHKIENQDYLDFCGVIEATFKCTMTHLGEIWPSLWDMEPTKAGEFLRYKHEIDEKRRAKLDEEILRARRFR